MYVLSVQKDGILRLTPRYGKFFDKKTLKCDILHKIGNLMEDKEDSKFDDISHVLCLYI